MSSRSSVVAGFGCACLLFSTATAQQPKLPTRAECDALGRRVEETINQGDFDFLNQVFDKDAFIGRVTDGLDLPEPFGTSFRAGLAASFQTAPSDMVKNFIGPRGTMKFLRTLPGKRQPRLLFRLLTKGGDFTYDEYLADRDASGAVRFVDHFGYLTGSTSSKYARSILFPGAQLTAEQQNRLTPHERLLIDGGWIYMGFREAAATRNVEQALSLYEQLSPALKNCRDALFSKAKLLVASKDTTAVLELLHQLMERFPNDIAIRYLTIGPFLESGKFDELLASIDAIEKHVGGDPNLHAYRAIVLQRKKQFDRAFTLYERSIAEEPGLLRVYGFEMIKLAIRLQDAARASKLVENLAATPGMKSAEELLALPDLAPLRDTPECQAMLKRLGNQSAGTAR